MEQLKSKQNIFEVVTEDGYFKSLDYRMGTIIEQKVYCDNAQEAYAILREVSLKLKELEGNLSFFQPGSDVSRLNSCAGKKYIEVSSDLKEIIKKVNLFNKLSEGAFDITAAPLIDLWRRHQKQSTLPDENEIKKLLPLVDGKSIIINTPSQSVKLLRKGQSIDLGGIGKGYAADAAKKIYIKMGIKSAFINLGGNVQVLGKNITGEPWVIGIQNPRAKRGTYMAAVEIKNKSVVTSGDYEKCFWVDGRRYHHIIDPKSGYPAMSGLISVSVIAPLSMEADILSTAAFVMGLEKGMQLIKKTNSAEAIFVTDDKKIFLTSGLKDDFLTFHETDDYKFFIY